MLIGKDKKRQMKLGTVYELNQDLVEKKTKKMIEEEILNATEMITDFFKAKEDMYFMLLCNEQKDYTLFNYKDNKNDDKCSIAAKEVIECLSNRGELRVLDKTEKEDAIECWISDGKKCHCYFLFPYTNGVIEL